MRTPAAALLLLAAAATARAQQPVPVEVKGCDGLDRDDVERELGAELVGNDASSGVVAVEIACPVPERGVITVRRAGGPASTRTLALADVEVAAWPRVAALVIAETLPATVTEVARARPRRRVGFTGRAAVRAFADGGAVLWGGELGVVLGRFGLGVVATGTSADDTLGTVRPWVIDGAATARVLCAVRGSAELCLCARLEAGVAFASAGAGGAGVAAATVSAPYLQAGGAVSAGAGPLVVEAGVGWAEGLVVLADKREAARLAGPVLMLSIGARLAP